MIKNMMSKLFEKVKKRVAYIVILLVGFLFYMVDVGLTGDAY